MNDKQSQIVAGAGVTDDPVKAYLSGIGKRGGASGRGKSKARTSDQARAAVQVRWAKHRAAHQA